MEEKREFAVKLLQILEEKMDGYTLNGPLEIMKNNAQKLTAISISAEGSNIGKTIYVESYMHDLKNGKTMEEIAEEIAELAMSETPEELASIAEKLLDADYINKNLRLKVVSAGGNVDLLKDSVYRKIEDLAAVAYINVECGAGNGSIRITPQMLDSINMTSDEVLKQAMKNNDAEEYKVQSIEEVLREMMGGELPEEVENSMQEGPSMMYVLTNQEKTFGAAVLASKIALTQAMKQVGEECYILPSSVHELLLVPKSCGQSLEELREMVREVNLTQVAAVDILSNEVYEIDPATQKLSIAGKSIEKSVEGPEKRILI